MLPFLDDSLTGDFLNQDLAVLVREDWGHMLLDYSVGDSLFLLQCWTGYSAMCCKNWRCFAICLQRMIIMEVIVCSQKTLAVILGLL